MVVVRLLHLRLARRTRSLNIYINQNARVVVVGSGSTLRAKAECSEREREAAERFFFFRSSAGDSRGPSVSAQTARLATRARGAQAPL